MPISTTPLEQAVWDQYPSYERAVTLYAWLSQAMSLLSPDGRRFASRILSAAAQAVDLVASDAQHVLVAPQILMLITLSERLRELAIKAKRYANVSLGLQHVVLTSAAIGALAAFELNDPGRGTTAPLDPTRDLIALVEGMRLQ